MTDRRQQDDEHLRMLAIFHYVLAGIVALIALFPVFHLLIGLFIVLAPEAMETKGDPPPAFFGWIFVSFAAMFILAGWILAILLLITGRKLAKRKHRTFCLVMAGIECLIMPIGTVLGVFTIVVLMRESVAEQFAAGQPAPKASAEFEESFRS